MAQLTIVNDATELAAAAAGRITALLASATSRSSEPSLVLAGGRTPEPVYQRLASPEAPWRNRINWPELHLFWTDERNVGPDDPASNFGVAWRALIQHVPVPATHVHRVRGEIAAAEAAREYQSLLQSRKGAGIRPLFDVTVLGIGADAHIASIFPGSQLIASRHRPTDTDAVLPVGRGELAAAVWAPALSQWRITLTPAALLSSNAIVVLTEGSSKADAVAAAIELDADVDRYPAQLLRDAGERVEWIIDSAAAARLRAGRHA